jgi:membrane protein DedA with SNARE-associated domain
MTNWFSDAAAHLSNPWLQGLISALGALVLEDPTVVGAGLLVAERQMSFWAAWGGISFGLILGDLFLYVAGRVLGERVLAWGVPAPYLEHARQWYARNTIKALLASRFILGLRLPAYLAAGIARVRFWEFLLIDASCCIIWAWALLNLTIRIGENLLPLLGQLKWPVAIAVVLSIVVLDRLTRHRVLGPKKDEASVCPPHLPGEAPSEPVEVAAQPHALEPPGGTALRS